MSIPIPVICDRCRARGAAGDDEFADFGDLLDFEPVPRRPRADGWAPELQRAFIAALAVTGSPRRAAKAVGKAQFGVDQLRKAKGSEGFNAAFDRALALYREKGDRRLAAGFAAIVREDSKLHPGTELAEAAPAAPDERSEAERAAAAEQAAEDWLANLLNRYGLKVRAEREARLRGHIVAADFYVRQLSFIEVALDLGGGGWAFLQRVHRGEIDAVNIAATPMSLLLDEVRREEWARHGEPERPPPPSSGELVDRGTFFTARGESFQGGPDASVYAWQNELREKHRAAAEAQLKWEAQARRDYERRREATPLIDEEPRQAGQPAPDGRQD